MLFMRPSSVLTALYMLVAVDSQGQPPELVLNCLKSEFRVSESQRCRVVFVNPIGSTVKFVPREAFPIPLSQWPRSLLEIRIRGLDNSNSPVNTFVLRGGNVDPGGFRGEDMILLDAGQLYGWELDLRAGNYWRFALPPGEYLVSAHFSVGLATAHRDPRFRRNISVGMGKRFSERDSFLLEGEFESNSVRLRILPD